MFLSVDITRSDPGGLEGVAKAIGVRLGFCDVIDVPAATRNAMRVGAMDYEN